MTREQEKLIIQNQRFIYSLAFNFWKSNRDLNIDDCKSEAMICACEIVPIYDETRGANFRTFIEKKVTWRLGDFARKERRFTSRIDQSANYDVADDGVEKSEIDGVSRDEFPVLSRRLIGHTLHEIGEIDEVNKSTVMRRERKEIERLRNKNGS